MFMKSNITSPDMGRSLKKKRSRSSEEEELKDLSNYMSKKAKKIHSFVWSKKIERDLAQGVVFSVKSEKKRQRERTQEIEKIKKRSDQRAAEKALRDEELTLLARERSRTEFEESERKEQEFLLHQSKARSRIRLSEGRAKPIDTLFRNIDEDDFVVDPVTVFKGLTAREIAELRDDIVMNLDFDNGEYWKALLVVCDWELGNEGGFLDSRIEADVKKHLQGKTHCELVALQSEIELKMVSGTAMVVEFWEAIIKYLPIYKARACLNEMRKRPRERDQEEKEADEEHIYKAQSKERDQEEEEKGVELEEECGSCSPQLIDGDDQDYGIDPEEDKAILGTKREAVLEAQQRRLLDSSSSSMYQPRKPKYFNRIHTGYEWNNYNQKHYDHDNPPPKAVQGYKFNIFYPDLIDKTRAPTFTVVENSGEQETCIIRFHAGPPYEDIAFKIVNKEWERSYKKGFKCTFERGTLHLYFNFERYRYRR